MRYSKYLLSCALFISLGTTYSAAANTNSESQTINSVQDVGRQTMMSGLSDGIYKFRKDTKITPFLEIIDGKLEVNNAGETLAFEKEEPVALKIQSSGDVQIHLLLSPEEKGRTPEVILIPRQEFLNKADVEFVELGDESFLRQNYLIDAPTDYAGPGRKRARMHFRGAGGCVAYVMKKLNWRGPIGNGHKVTTTLKKAGWVPVSCNKAPLGAVASWTGGRHGKGHTAYKEPSGWCYDLNCKDPGKLYRLKECVVMASNKSNKTKKYKTKKA